MARREKKQKKKSDSRPEALTPRLRFHLKCLHLDSAEEYLAWCRTHGYEARLTKTEAGLRRELEEAQRRTAIEAMGRARRARDPASVLVRVCLGEIESEDVPMRMKEACARLEALPDDRAHRTELAELLLVVSRRTRFLLESRRFGTRSLLYLDAIVGLHERRHDWIRPSDAFRPRTHNRDRQFSALAQHLLARYPVPTFLDAAWFRRDCDAARMRDWYVHLGRGRSLRTADTPIRVTRRIAHHFCQAPANVTVEAALRWAQVRAQGGSEVLARAITDTPVGASLEHDAFWQSVIRFFIEQPCLMPGEVGPIVDYIRHQKFESLEVVHADGRVEERPPPKPGFSMHYRTLSALLTAVSRWHRQLAGSTGSLTVWAPTGIRPYCDETGTATRGNRKIWRIEELRSRGALAFEGRLMRHCVASYAPGCIRGSHSIWSLSVETEGITRRVQTIQVSKYKTIVQCRGKLNRMPTDVARRVILRWATLEDIAPGVLV